LKRRQIVAADVRRRTPENARKIHGGYEACRYPESRAFVRRAEDCPPYPSPLAVPAARLGDRAATTPASPVWPEGRWATHPKLGLCPHFLKIHPCVTDNVANRFSAAVPRRGGFLFVPISALNEALKTLKV